MDRLEFRVGRWHAWGRAAGYAMGENGTEFIRPESIFARGTNSDVVALFWERCPELRSVWGEPARLDFPQRPAVNGDGTKLYFVDFINHKIKCLDVASRVIRNTERPVASRDMPSICEVESGQMYGLRPASVSRSIGCDAVPPCRV